MKESERIYMYIGKYIVRNYAIEEDGNLEQLLNELRDAEYAEAHGWKQLDLYGDVETLGPI